MNLRNFLLFVILTLVLFLDSFSFSVILNKKVCIPIFAVVKGENEITGAASTLCLKIVNGSGNVFISTLPLSGEGTQAYASVAVEVACKYALSVDCNKYDFLFSIYSDSSSVEGPSASAAMALLTFALLMNLTIPKDVGITGMILPDGTVGLVGGVYYKAEAARKIGIKRFFIPLGNEKDYVYKEKSFNKGNVIISQTSVEEINLIDYFKDKGLSIIPVSNFLELLSKVFGENVLNLFKSEKSYKDLYEKIFKDLMKVSYKSLIKYLNKTNKEEAIECTSKYDYYSCSSLAFVKYIEQVKKEIRENVSKLTYSEIPLYLNKLKKDLLLKVGDWWKIVRELENDGKNVINFEIFSILVDRLYDLEKSLEEINIYGEDLNQIIDKLAYCYGRLVSIESWYETYKKAKEIKGLKKVEVNKEYIKYYVKRIIGIVETELLYLSRYGYNVQELQNYLDFVKSIEYEGYYLVAFYKAKEIEARISSTVLMAMISNLDGEKKKDVVKKIYDLNSKFLEKIEDTYLPFLAKCYINYAKYWLKENKMNEALLYISYSSVLSTTFKIYKGMENVRYITEWKKVENMIKKSESTEYDKNSLEKSYENLKKIVFYLVVFILLITLFINLLL